MAAAASAGERALNKRQQAGHTAAAREVIISRLPAAMLPSRKVSSLLREPFLELCKDFSQLIPDLGKSLIQINDMSNFSSCSTGLLRRYANSLTLSYDLVHLMLSYLNLFYVFFIISNVR